ncbi:MAG: hypothetical protein AAGJ93_06050 [Bacteroidota bacterium]
MIPYTYPGKPERTHSDLVYYDKYSTTWGLSINPLDYEWASLMLTNGKIVKYKVKPDFIRICSEYSGPIIKPIYDQHKYSIGLIGSYSPLENDTTIARFADLNYTSEKFDERVFKKIAGPDNSYGQTFADSNWIYNLQLDSLNLNVDFKFDRGSAGPIRIKLIADLDNDGLDDFIILSHTIWDLHETILFLSSSLQNGYYVKTISSILDFD